MVDMHNPAATACCPWLTNSIFFSLMMLVLLLPVPDLRSVMRAVPSSVVVVTTKDPNSSKLRGVTCSSFTSISLSPPIISFCMQKRSRMHNLLLETGRFAVSVLSDSQANMSIHFSTPVLSDINQFEKIPYFLKDDLPILEDSTAYLLCNQKEFHEIGDHTVWYGDVFHSEVMTDYPRPLLYYARSYRSVSDDAFVTAFEETTLPFDYWTHQAHVRLAWSYFKENDWESSLNLIRTGIQRYNERNKDKVYFGYSETITIFFSTIVHKALLNSSEAAVNSFEEFLNEHPYLLDRSFPFQFYSRGVFLSEKGKATFLPPDISDFERFDVIGEQLRRKNPRTTPT